MRIVEKTFRFRFDGCWGGQWISGNLCFCGFGFDDLLRQFALPDDLGELTVAVYDRPGKNRVPAKVSDWCKESKDLLFEVEGCEREYLGGKVGRALKPYLDKQVYLQVEYEE